MCGARGESGVIRNSIIRFVRLAGEQFYRPPSFHDKQSSWYVLLLIHYGHIANRTNFFYYYCPVKLYDKLRFFYRTVNILLEDTMA